jgi:hypothetical protein
MNQLKCGWLTGIYIHTTAKARTLVRRLDVYIHWPQLYSGDDIGHLFDVWEIINKAKDEITV